MGRREGWQKHLLGVWPWNEAEVLRLPVSVHQDAEGRRSRDAAASSPSPAALPPRAATWLSGEDLSCGRIRLLTVLTHLCEF